MKNRKPLYDIPEEDRAKVKYYRIFKCPNTPTGKCEYIGNTPIYEQAIAAVEGYNEKGQQNNEVYALSAVLHNGAEIFIL